MYKKNLRLLVLISLLTSIIGNNSFSQVANNNNSFPFGLTATPAYLGSSTVPIPTYKLYVGGAVKIFNAGNTGLGSASLHLINTSTNGRKYFFLSDTNGSLSIIDSLFATIPRFIIKNSGNIGIGNASPTAKFVLENGTAAQQVMIVRGATAQSANLQEWQTITGKVRTAISADGREFTVGVPNSASGSGDEGSMVIGGQGKIKFYNNTSSTNLFESYGIHATGDAQRPFNVDGGSLVVGYPSDGTNYGINNALIAGKMGIGITSPTSLLHLKAGSATAGTAPLKFTSGINLSTPEAGAMEFNGTSLFFTPSNKRNEIAFADLSNISGILGVAKGGTGLTTLTKGDLLYAAASNSLDKLTAGTNGQILTLTGGVPAWSTPSLGNAGTVTSIGLTMPVGFIVDTSSITTNGSFTVTTLLNGLLRANGTGFSIGQANLASEVTGTLPIANGGSGAVTANAALNNLLPLQTGSNSKILQTDGTNANWVTNPATGSNWSILGNGSTTASNFIGTTDAQRLILKTNNIEQATILPNGNVGIGNTLPTSVLHLKAGTATASSSPLKFTSGVNLTIPEAGAIEFNGASLFFTPSSTRNEIAFADLSNISGTLGVTKGGTGLTTLAAGDIIYGSAVNTLGKLAVGTNGQVLTLASGVPKWVTPAAGNIGTVTSVGLTMPTGFIVNPASITTTGSFGVTTSLDGLLRANGTGFITGQANLASEVTGTLPIANGGSGAVTANAALNNLLPLQTGSSSKILQTDGTNASWVTPAVGNTGTVTSIGLTMPTGFNVNPASITTSGALAVTTNLNGLLRANGTGFATGQANLASEVTGSLPIENGGSGAATANGALNNLLPSQTGNTGKILQTDGISASWLPNAAVGTNWSIIGNSGTTTSNYIGTTDDQRLIFKTNNIEQATILSNGNVGIGNASPTSLLHLKAGTSLASSSPLKFTSGINLTTPEAGAMEFNGTSLFFTPSTTRNEIAFADLSNISGILGVAKGGTGLTTLTTGDLLYAATSNTIGKLPVGTNGQILTLTGGVPAWSTPAAPPPAGWGLGGNAGTTPETHFIGTTDGQALILKTNGVQIAKFSGDGNAKIMMGSGADASGNMSTAIGAAVHANGTGSTALGFSTTANGAYSVALGTANSTSGAYSTAMGNNSIASGPYATAVGFTNVAGGYMSLAAGSMAIASGQYALSIGSNTKANANYSTAMGVGSIADGLASLAIGNNIKTKSYSETAVGLYNDASNAANSADTAQGNQVFAIGIGKSDAIRANAMTVLYSGNVGIGKLVPQAKLHITSGDSNALRIEAPLATGLSSDSLLVRSNDGTIKIIAQAAPQSNGWSLTGNAGTNSTTYFIGTTDNAGVAFRTNNTSKLLIDATGNIGIGTISPAAQLHTTGTIRFDKYKNNASIDSVLTTDENGDLKLKYFIAATGTGTGTGDDTKWTLRYGNIFSKAIANVGIGVDSATARLHTSGSVRFESFKNNIQGDSILSTDQFGNLKLLYMPYGTTGTSGGGAVGGGVVYTFKNGLKSNSGIVSMGGQLEDSVSLNLAGNSFNINNGPEKIFMASAAYNNVGIGTMPVSGYKMSVNGDVNIGNAFDNPGAGAKLWFNGAGNNDKVWMSRFNTTPGNTELRVNIGGGTGENDKFNIGYDSANTWNTKFVVQNNGIVGIGTSQLTGELSIGSAHGNKLSIGNSSWAKTTVISTGNNGDANGDFTDMLVPGQNYNTAVIRMNSKGNVGIGTSLVLPLDTAYRLSVNGKIRAKGLRVQTEGWSDFVFEPGYKLITLEEVETYIKKHKHLPEIASAEEVIAEGNDVGETQVKLLQKVEELTLYVIEQGKQLKMLEEKNKSLEARNMEIENMKKQLANLEALIKKGH